MIWLILIAILLVAFVLALVAATSKSETYPYVKQGVLFSKAERSFLGVLDQAVGADYRIFGKVRIGDVLGTRKGLDKSRSTSARNRIRSKHFDFVLCDKRDLSVVCAIELDDKSHKQRERKERDDFINSACKAASLPLVRIPAQAGYAMAEVRSEILVAIGGRSEPTLSDAALDAAATADPRSRATPYISPEPETPACPKCSASMVRRRATGGARAGQEFWTCSTFPKCPSIVPIG